MLGEMVLKGVCERSGVTEFCHRALEVIEDRIRMAAFCKQWETDVFIPIPGLMNKGVERSKECIAMDGILQVMTDHHGFFDVTKEIDIEREGVHVKLRWMTHA